MQYEGPQRAVHGQHEVRADAAGREAEAHGRSSRSSRPRCRSDAQWLQDLYGSQGYVFADVQPETVFLEEPGQVDLVYHIEEGERWRVGRIFVHIGGDNPHTRIQTALNRVTLRPGQIMDIRELKASERRLMASSLFHVDAAVGAAAEDHLPHSRRRGPGLRGDGRRADVRGQSPDDAGPAGVAAAGLAVHVAGAAAW